MTQGGPGNSTRSEALAARLGRMALNVSADVHQTAAEIRRQMSLAPTKRADLDRIAGLCTHLVERTEQLHNLLDRMGKP